MPLIARQRSRLAVLAVLALVGSLLAVSAVQVAAKDGQADAEAMYSACVGAAAEDAGFEDMVGSFAEDAANCLAHYEITKGTSEGTFSPNASISRLQMALFLARAAGPAGITLPVASDQGFTDIDGYTAEIQEAINQVAGLGIMAGRSDEMFSPAGLVNRRDMAVHLDAFLDNAVVGPGGQDIDKVKPDDNVFTDISGVTVAAYGAIRNLYEMGVTQGKTDTMFAPDGLVSRGQMALFITRALAHTNARPAGLSIQVDKTDAFEGDVVKFVASIRDSSHMPMVNKSVDVFYNSSDEEPFKADGACTSNVGNIGGTSVCEIDAGDLTTNSRGNVSGSTHGLSSGTQVWAWTGDLGDEFDNDTTDSATISISVSAAAANTRITNSAATNTVHFGDTVTFTFQLVDKNGKAVAKKGAAVIVSSRVVIDADSDGQGSDRSTGRTDTHTTDASGRIELSYTENDPDSAAASDDKATLTLNVTIPNSGGVGKLVDGNGNDAATQITVMWDDDKSAASNLKLSSAASYHVASSAGKGVSNTVQATLTDQYGDPVSGAKVDFRSNDSAGAPSESRTTGDDGVASLSYLRDSANNGKETISASAGAIKASSLMHYWVASSTDGSGMVLVADTANDTVVAEESDGDIVYVEYDSNDQFTSGSVRKVMANFEKDLGADLSKYELSLVWDIAVDAKGAKDADLVSMFTLSSKLIGVDTTAPAVQTAGTSYDGGSIELTYDEDLDVASEPATSAFAVRVTVNENTPEETIRHTAVSAVSVLGSKVTLTISPKVKVGDAIKVTYTQPAANALQDAAENKSASVSSMPVTNNVDVIAPVLNVAADRPKTSLDGSSITLTYEHNRDGDSFDTKSLPLATDFEVRVNGKAREVKSVSFSSASTVELTLAEVCPDPPEAKKPMCLTEASRITVGYTEPEANALQDIAGNKAASVHPAVSVRNLVDVTAPKFTLDTDTTTPTTSPTTNPVMSIDGTVVKMTYTDLSSVGLAGSGLDEASIPAVESFEVLVDNDADVTVDPDNPDTTPSTERKVKSVTIKDNVVSLHLDVDEGDDPDEGKEPVEYGQYVSVRYTKATFGDDEAKVVQDKAGNDAAELQHATTSAFLVNTVDSDAPELVTATDGSGGDVKMSTDGTYITLDYTDGNNPAGTGDTNGSGLDPDFVPALSSFKVVLFDSNDVPTRVYPSKVTITLDVNHDDDDGTTPVRDRVTLELPEPVRVTNGQTVTLTYDNEIAGTPLQDMVGNLAPSIPATGDTPQRVITSVVEDAVPGLITADPNATPPVVPVKMRADGLSIDLFFDEPLDEASVPATGRFTVLVNGSEVALASVTVDADGYDPDTNTADDETGKVTLTLRADEKLIPGRVVVVTVDYTEVTPGRDDRSGVLQHETGGRDVASFLAPQTVDTSAIGS